MVFRPQGLAYCGTAVPTTVDRLLLLIAAMKYRVLVVAEGKHFGLSTSRLYIRLKGEFKETRVMDIPRGEYETEFEVCLYYIVCFHDVDRQVF